MSDEIFQNLEGLFVSFLRT